MVPSKHVKLFDAERGKLVHNATRPHEGLQYLPEQILSLIIASPVENWKRDTRTGEPNCGLKACTASAWLTDSSIDFANHICSLLLQMGISISVLQMLSLNPELAGHITHVSWTHGGRNYEPTTQHVPSARSQISCKSLDE